MASTSTNRHPVHCLPKFGEINLPPETALLALRIRDIPVRYRDRTYGETNISRFAHGWMLLKMVWFGLRKLKWI